MAQKMDRDESVRDVKLPIKWECSNDTLDLIKGIDMVNKNNNENIEHENIDDAHENLPLPSECDVFLTR